MEWDPFKLLFQYDTTIIIHRLDVGAGIRPYSAKSAAVLEGMAVHRPCAKSGVGHGWLLFAQS